MAESVACGQRHPSSNADGLVVFEVDESMWPEDVTLSATAYKDGYLKHTLAGIARPSNAEPLTPTIHPYWQEPPDSVRVSTTVLNHRPSAERLYVGSTAPCSYAPLALPFSSRQLKVPRGVPFDLYAMEATWFGTSSWNYTEQFFDWADGPSDAPEEDTILDIDFVADAVEPTEFAGSFTLSQRVESPLYGPIG